MSNYKRVVIIANGSIIQPEFCASFIKKSDFVISVDGGIRYLENTNIVPDLMIGDFDSIESKILKKYKDLGVNIKEFPRDKDYTDTELALLEARNITSSVVLIGAFGNRMDHTFANVYLLYEAQELGIEMEIVDMYHSVFLVKKGDKKEIPGDIGDIVSIIPILPFSIVTTSGLRYPLKEEELKFGHARGISNVKIEKDAWVFVKEGAMLVFIVKKEVEKNENRTYK